MTMGDRLVDSPSGHRLHGHLSWVFNGRDEFAEAAAAFLADGPAQNERLLYAADASVEELVADVSDLPDRDALLESGALVVMPLNGPEEPVASMGLEERERMFRSLIDSALADGYAGVRAAVDTTSMAADADGRMQQARWERRGDRLIARRPLVALCGADRSVLGDLATAHLACLHPSVRAPVELAPFSAFVHGDGLALAGEADALSADLLTLALEASPPEPATVTLDLGRLDFIDGAAFAAVERYAVALEAAGGRMVVTSARSIVRRMASLLGATDRIVFAEARV
jgi:anti-anti-sigma regulatory factor